MNQDHRVPAIDRAMAILEAIGRYRGGLPLATIARDCRLTRSTAYRILNSLIAANLVRRARQPGHYALGHRLLALAAGVRASFGAQDLVALGHPQLERLSALTGEASKLSVLADGRALCIDAVPGRGAYALSPVVGQSFPLHAGAASKVLLADLPEDARSEFLARPLLAHTAHTVVDPQALAAELARIAARGWAEDRSEHRQGVSALAAPVRNAAGSVLATVSMTYLAERHPEMQQTHLADLQHCCTTIATALARHGA